MVDAGRGKMSRDLLILRDKCLDATREMARAGFVEDILAPVPDKKELDKILLEVQSRITRAGLNSKYTEKSRMIATAAIIEQMKRRSRNLVGRAIYIDSREEDPKTGEFIRWTKFSAD